MLHQFSIPSIIHIHTQISPTFLLRIFIALHIGVVREKCSVQHEGWRYCDRLAEKNGLYMAFSGLVNTSW